MHGRKINVFILARARAEQRSDTGEYHAWTIYAVEHTRITTVFSATDMQDNCHRCTVKNNILCFAKRVYAQMSIYVSPISSDFLLRSKLSLFYMLFCIGAII